MKYCWKENNFLYPALIIYLASLASASGPCGHSSTVTRYSVLSEAEVLSQRKNNLFFLFLLCNPKNGCISIANLTVMQKIHLSIPGPCHQNWNEMTPTQQGRFCNSCAKQVVDFSTMSDTQVLHYFSSIKNENVCGRAYPDQLERAITMPKEHKKKLFWYWNYITMLFLFFSKTNTVKAQGGIKVVVESKHDAAQQDRITKGEIAVNTNRIIKGKIIDEAGQPLAGVSVIIKDSKHGTIADTNGFYSISANTQKDILKISAVGFVSKEIKLASLNHFDIILTKMEMQMMGDVVVTVGDIGFRNLDEDYVPVTKPKHIAVLEVKDNATLQPINKASIVIKSIGANKSAAVFTDKNGIYKLRKIEEEENYAITIFAEGYEKNEFTIKGNDISLRKITKKILLKKVIVKVLAKDAKPAIIWMGKITSTAINNKPILYVVDNVPCSKKIYEELNPDNIENITVLKGQEATAIYGASASAGAIIITTKKKETFPSFKNLDTVVISTSLCTKRRDITGMVSVMTATTSDLTIKKTFADSIKLVTTKITGAIKIYPNPIQRGNSFSLSLKLKQTGMYNIQIVDAAGRVVLQKQTIAISKAHTEQMQTNSIWSSGIYYVRIFNEKNNFINTNSFSLQ
jgi:TonB-dependent SusC/RagA subfamily outer membrane receptor